MVSTELGVGTGRVLRMGTARVGSSSILGICPFCGAVEKRRLGECSVCHHTVCEQCGNVQFVGGERKPVHRECLREDEDAFKMIKFVR